MNVSERCPVVVFKSEYGNSLLLPVTFTEDITQQIFNQHIASVAIDTKCLKHSNIQIEFSGTLNETNTIGAESALVFTLFRNCSGGDLREPLTTFSFFITNIVAGAATSNTIVFKYLSKDQCGECCSYVLELTSISNIGAGTITFSMNDGVISALATEA